MGAVLLACATMAVYFTGFTVFKMVVPHVGTLSSARPFQATGRLIINPRWLVGLVVLLAGLAMESLLLLDVPLAVAVPVLIANLVFLLPIAVIGFGERLSSREWVGLLTIALAVLMLAVSAGLPGADVTTPVWEISRLGWGPALAVSLPPLVICIWLFCLRDGDEGGKHARPLNGIAPGVGAGALVGAAAVLAMGTGRMIENGEPGLWTSPGPYLIVLTGGLGLGLAQIAMQHCRLFVIVTIVMATSKIFLLVTGTLLYGQPWPHGLGMRALQIFGILLVALAVWIFPRHEQAPRADYEDLAGPRAPEPLNELPNYSGHHRRMRGLPDPAEPGAAAAFSRR